MRWGLGTWSFLLLAGALQAQNICPATPVFSICDITFDLPAGGPKTVELNGEFRGPSHKTFLSRAFASGSNRMVVRFSPYEAGTWDVRFSSSVAAFHDKQMQFTATASASTGWVETANVHHFRNSGGDRAAHLWIGDTAPLENAGFEAWASDRAAAGVTHIRVQIPSAWPLGQGGERAFDDIDSRLGIINAKGMTADLVVIPPTGADREGRQAYFRYVMARCAARNATWVMLDEFEKYDHVHELLREIAGYLNEDPFHRLRTVGAAVTSAPFADEKWMNLRSYGTPEWSVAAIEDQIFSSPAVSAVAGASGEEFRHRLWNASMSGAYPEAVTSDASMLQSLRVWRTLFADTRFWDLEPFFDADGARGLSLPDTEYILYLEKPGPVTVQLERKHKWSGIWLNPLTGERVEIDNFKEDSFSGAPPDSLHDWVLHIYREGHKESLKSYRFESRPVILQEVEVSLAKTPFEIAKPSGDSIPFNQPVPYSAHLKKETRATRRMVYLWTGEVTADGEGYRVLGSGAEGTMKVPASIVRHFPATFHMRVYGMNGLGKLYSVDQNFGMTQ